MRMTLIDDSAMIWMPFKADSLLKQHEREIDDEVAERWLRIQAEWELMQDEIRREVRG